MMRVRAGATSGVSEEVCSKVEVWSPKGAARLFVAERGRERESAQRALLLTRRRQSLWFWAESAPSFRPHSATARPKRAGFVSAPPPPLRTSGLWFPPPSSTFCGSSIKLAPSRYQAAASP